MQIGHNSLVRQTCWVQRAVVRMPRFGNLSIGCSFTGEIHSDGARGPPFSA
jgi:hypothetical protein